MYHFVTSPVCTLVVTPIRWWLDSRIVAMCKNRFWSVWEWKEQSKPSNLIAQTRSESESRSNTNSTHTQNIWSEIWVLCIVEWNYRRITYLQLEVFIRLKRSMLSFITLRVACFYVLLSQQVESSIIFVLAQQMINWKRLITIVALIIFCHPPSSASSSSSSYIYIYILI